MAIEGSCSLADCRVAAGEACLEGFSDLANCPNFSSELKVEDDSIIENEEQPEHTNLEVTPSAEDDRIVLPSGEALTAKEAQALMSEIRTTVVMLVGMAESGKTTLLAEIYEKYRLGPFANHLFAGTRTIIGFEQICHYARAVSQGNSEDTSRTVKEIENNLLHFDFVDLDTRLRKRLLISDISGEHFEDGTHTSELLGAIPYLRRADHFVLFADSEKLRDRSTRQALLNQILVLLRGCAEASLVNPSCYLTVVISRHDLINENSSDEKSTEEFLQYLREKITERAHIFVNTSPTFLNLAARPKNPDSKQYGLEQVVSILLTVPELAIAETKQLNNAKNGQLRQIDSMIFKGP